MILSVLELNYMIYWKLLDQPITNLQIRKPKEYQMNVNHLAELTQLGKRQQEAQARFLDLQILLRKQRCLYG